MILRNNVRLLVLPIGIARLCLSNIRPEEGSICGTANFFNYCMWFACIALPGSEGTWFALHQFCPKTWKSENYKVTLTWNLRLEKIHLSLLLFLSIHFLSPITFIYFPISWETQMVPLLLWSLWRDLSRFSCQDLHRKNYCIKSQKFRELWLRQR